MTAVTRHDNAYVVPTLRLAAIVHIRNPAFRPAHEPAWDSRTRAGAPTRLTADSHDGLTWCGRPMLCADQWVPDPRPSRVCPDCLEAANPYHQETML